MWLIIDLVVIFICAAAFLYLMGRKLKHKGFSLPKIILVFVAEVALMLAFRKISFGYARLVTGEYFDYVKTQILWMAGICLGSVYVWMCRDICFGSCDASSSDNTSRITALSIIETAVITSLFMGGVVVLASHLRYLLSGMVLLYGGMLLVHYVYARFIYPHRIIAFRIRYLSLPVIVSVLMMGQQLMLCGSPDLLTWKTFALNILLLLALLIVVMLLIGNMNIAVSVCLVLNMCWTLVHYYVYRCRGTVFVPIDIAGAGTAAQVASNYMFTIDRQIWALLALTFVFSAVILYCPNIVVWNVKLHTGENKKNFLCSCICILVICAGLYAGFRSDFIDNFELPFDSYDQASTYNHSGLTLGFIMFAKEAMLDKPDGYSEEVVEEVAARYGTRSDTDAGQNEKDDSASSCTPDIIVIMNESWADIADIGSFESNTDYMPFYHAMENGEISNTTTGRVLVSTYGGGTCNSEYEFLTGNSLELSPQMQPFVTEINSDRYSIVSTLKDQGYFTAVTHPSDGTSWNREKVYSCLGMDEMHFIDSYPEDSEYVRKYMSDIEVYRQILNWYPDSGSAELDSPLFCFGVTIQNHGSYYYKVFRDGDADIPIHVASEEEPGTLSEYLSLTYETDKALEYLVSEIDARERPTILVMFGDHFPGGDLYDSLDDVYYTGLEYEERTRSTPFLIHTNYDCDMTEIGDYFSLPYLGAEVLKLSGAELTPYQRYLLDMEKKVPLINSLGFSDEEGEWHDLTEISDYDSIYETIGEYNILQYNYRRGGMSEELFGTLTD